MQSTTFLNDISQDAATRAFSGTSFSPEKRGASYRQDYADTLAGDYAKMRQESETGGTADILEDEFSRYHAGYLKRYKAWLASRSRCISSMITGGSNFPVRMADKRNNVEHKRSMELTSYRENALKAMVRNLRPDLRPIMSGDGDAVERLQADIAKAEANHAKMKEANSVLRKCAKGGIEAQVAALVAVGFSEKQAALMVQPDCFGGIGFASFELTNNNAKITRMKARLEQISTAKETPATEAQGDGVRIEDCPADNRVRLFFDGKPEESVRSTLKSNGFRWSPSIGAWQAYRNHRAMATAQSFVVMKCAQTAQPKP